MFRDGSGQARWWAHFGQGECAAHALPGRPRHTTRRPACHVAACMSSPGHPALQPGKNVVGLVKLQAAVRAPQVLRVPAAHAAPCHLDRCAGSTPANEESPTVLDNQVCAPTFQTPPLPRFLIWG